MKINYLRIGSNIRDLRSARGLTQAELAEKIDVSTPFVSKVERGVKHPSLETLICIASSLGTTLDVLLLGNQFNDRTTYQMELRETLKGCSIKEQEFILSVVKAMKIGLEHL